MGKCRVVVAPDSFKGTLTAAAAARAIGVGWSTVRPQDEVLLLPQADGGEGTLAALATAVPGAQRRTTGLVRGPDGRPVEGCWLQWAGPRAAVELASVSGLPLMRTRDPLGATTHGLGEVLRQVASAQPETTLVGLGGSGSTDGGAGLLTALGARFLDAEGRALPPGGAALTRLARVDLAALVQLPGRVIALADVTAPLLGPTGAAAVFGPQKGAGPSEVRVLEQGLTRLAEQIGVDPQQPGLGAAGGTAYALVAVLGAELAPGADFVAHTTGLPEAALTATVLITGEGHLDRTSTRGKVVGHTLRLPGPRHRIVIAGGIETAPAGCRAYSLTHLAGSLERAIADPAHWLTIAGAHAATELTGTSVG